MISRLQTEKIAVSMSAMGLLAVFACLAVPRANAEYQGGMGTSTLRSPLIQSAASYPPNVSPDPGAPPAPGDGQQQPPAVTSGMTGDPTLLPWVPSVPSNNASVQNSQINLPFDPSIKSDPKEFGKMLAPYIPAPPSTLGQDPGLVPTNVNGFKPPAAAVNINPQGGISGQAPIKRWQGQTSRDLGLYQSERNANKLGSQYTDFGQKLETLPSLTQRGVNPFVSQDGPRVATYPGQMDAASNRQPNLPNAQATHDLYGQRQKFKLNPPLSSVMTIAPF